MIGWKQIWAFFTIFLPRFSVNLLASTIIQSMLCKLSNFDAWCKSRRWFRQWCGPVCAGLGTWLLKAFESVTISRSFQQWCRCPRLRHISCLCCCWHFNCSSAFQVMPCCSYLVVLPSVPETRGRLLGSFAFQIDFLSWSPSVKKMKSRKSSVNQVREKLSSNKVLSRLK